MIAVAHTATTLGVEGHLIRIEADSSPGTPTFTIIGLPDRALGESRERVRAAIINSGFLFPAGRLLVNLSPADLRKTGMGFDLPLALALLCLNEQVTGNSSATMLAIGELALDGAVRPVAGVLAMVIAARKAGMQRCLIAAENAAEAALIEQIEIYAIAHLAEAITVLLGHGQRYIYQRQARQKIVAIGEDFRDVQGQLVAKRALEIAAAGGHNLCLIGPPGCGKTMLAKRLPSILPLMDEEEVLATTAIRSAAGMSVSCEGLQYERPFRAPHHTITQTALLGGGRYPKPGEVSLAHYGVLFLDEFPEFARATLETLRQPLEEGVVTVSRNAGIVSYPARFSLIVAMNPCPCGMRGEAQGDCRCDDGQMTRYTARLSGPLLDRIDLRVRVPRIRTEELRSRPSGESSVAVRERVAQSRAIQTVRYGASGALNSGASASRLRADDAIELEASNLLVTMGDKLRISARAFDRILRVGRTIADLAQHERITRDDILEAVSYR